MWFLIIMSMRWEPIAQAFPSCLFHVNVCDFDGRGVRVVEGARLELVYALIAYRGFESLPLRHP